MLPSMVCPPAGCSHRLCFFLLLKRTDVENGRFWGLQRSDCRAIRTVVTGRRAGMSVLVLLSSADAALRSMDRRNARREWWNIWDTSKRSFCSGRALSLQAARGLDDASAHSSEIVWTRIIFLFVYHTQNSDLQSNNSDYCLYSIDLNTIVIFNLHVFISNFFVFHLLQKVFVKKCKLL